MKSLSKSDNPAGKNILWSIFGIWTAMLLIAISVVCFYAPVIDAFGEWLSASLINRLYSFIIGLALITVGVIWIRFRK